MGAVTLRVKRDDDVESVLIAIDPTIGNLEDLAKLPIDQRIDLLADDANLESIVLNPRTLVTVAFALSNCEEIGLSPEDFARACGGKEFKAIRQEVFQSLADFFLAIGQTDKAARLIATDEATAEMRAKLAVEIQNPATRAILSAMIDGDKIRADIRVAVAERIGNTSGSQPAASA